MSELIERLEARRRMHDGVTADWHDQDGNPYTTTQCRKCFGLEYPCEPALLLDLAIAAEQRHQAEEYYKSAEWLELPTDEAMAWLDATQPTQVNAALDALTQHLLGSTTTQDGAA